MVRLPPQSHAAAFERYAGQENPAYFPLIAAVLSGAQAGSVLADRAEQPRQICVEHAFGFAQVFGTPVPAFEEALRHRWLVERQFESAKVRLYTPHCPQFLQGDGAAGLRSWRQHFQLDLKAFQDMPPPVANTQETCLRHASEDDMAGIDAAFGVVTRFWRTPREFAHSANAVLALVNNEPAALCYAAAVAGGKAEIDVMTLPTYRHLGLAKAVVQMFNARCLAQHLLPLWDCFTNNDASLALCRSSGFVPLGDPYPFFTINR